MILAPLVILAALATPPPPPAPWQTVARIRIARDDSTAAIGSAAIVASSDLEAVAITAAHLFGAAPQLGQPLRVDLFDGQIRGTRPGVVAFAASHPGTLVALEPSSDLALIRFTPGRQLPAAPLVPPDWQATPAAPMTAVGCPGGRDATAWTANVVRPEIHLANGRTLLECTHAPRLGRSGGGLYVPTGELAGICNYADPARDTGLYAAPPSIYRLLARYRATTPTDPATAPPPPTLGIDAMKSGTLSAALLAILAASSTPAAAQRAPICFGGICQTPQSPQSFAAPQSQSFAAPQISMQAAPYTERYTIPMQADILTTWTPQIRLEGIRQVGGGTNYAIPAPSTQLGQFYSRDAYPFGAYAPPSVDLNAYGTYAAPYPIAPAYAAYPRRGWRRQVTRFRTRTVDFAW